MFITFFENKYHIHQRPFLWNFTIVDGLLTKSGTKNGDDSSDKLLRQHVGMLSEPVTLWGLLYLLLRYCTFFILGMVACELRSLSGMTAVFSHIKILLNCSLTMFA